MAGCCKWPYTAIIAIVIAVIGAIILIIGGSLVPYFSTQMHRKIEEHVHPLKKDSDTFSAWQNWSHFKPIYRSFYFFNVSNPEEVVKTGENLTVSEIGPYVYRVNFHRSGVSFSADQNHVTFDLYKTYTFERNMSVGDESDVMTVVNLPILNLATRLIYESDEVSETLAEEIEIMDQGLFSQVNVSDLLWGYKNKQLKSILIFLYIRFGLDPIPINETTYGLMYQSGQRKRTTYEGKFRISTGADSMDTIYNVEQWNGHSSLNFWSGASNDIKGSEGYSWHVDLGSSGDQFIFDSEWCRSIRMTVSGQISNDNLTVNNYTYKDDAFSYQGENRGFCQPLPKNNVTCLDDGVLNNTKCKGNIPLLLSQPHFLGASESYRKDIRGLKPDRQKHSTTFKLEPWTGEVVEADRKLQLNAYVMKMMSFPDTTQFNDTRIVIPIAWMKESYRMTDDEEELLNSLAKDYVSLRKQYDGVQYALIGVGAFLFVCAIIALAVIVFLHKRGTSEEREPLLGGR